MSSITTKDGTEIFYKDWGTGQPIVFSHGWPLSVEREFEIERIQRHAVSPEPQRHIAQNETERQRNETTRTQPAQKLQHQQRREVLREWRQRGGDGKGKCSEDENTARPVNAADPTRRSASPAFGRR